ncbi:MAG: hypothetical protein ABJA87_12405 [bacterium]
MIVGSLLLFLAGVALLAAGLVSESIGLEVGSIAAALLAATVLYFGVRQRGGAVTEGSEALSTAPNLPPLKSSWSRQDNDAHPAGTDESVDQSPGWLLDGDKESAVADPTEGPDDPRADDDPDVESVTDANALRIAERTDDVLVVDGRPRYHLSSCPTLADDETVPLPVNEAREAGFTPCARCRPDSHILADAWRSRSPR